jgi:translation initiation factor 1
MSESELVYSTDPERNRKCEKCKKLIPECICGQKNHGKISDYIAVLRLESANRGGKIVTVIDKLPPTEKYLASLAAELKNRCGAGGTYRTGNPYGKIEIQGDKRELIRKVLLEKGIRSKG